MMANEKTYSITLPNGDVHQRKSGRPYTFAIATIITEEYRASVINKIATEIVFKNARIAFLAPLINLPEQIAAFEAAALRVVYLEEKVEETCVGFQGKPYTRTCERWLTDTFKTETVGYEKPEQYGAASRAWNDAGLNAIQAARAALEATAQGEIDKLAREIECAERNLAHQKSRLVVGSALEVNWSQSDKAAHNQAAQMSKRYMFCTVRVIRSDEIAVHVPKRRAAKA
jgi:hypothetical protein